MAERRAQNEPAARDQKPGARAAGRRLGVVGLAASGGGGLRAGEGRGRGCVLGLLGRGRGCVLGAAEEGVRLYPRAAGGEGVVSWGLQGRGWGCILGPLGRWEGCPEAGRGTGRGVS